MEHFIINWQCKNFVKFIQIIKNFVKFIQIIDNSVFMGHVDLIVCTSGIDHG